MILRIAAFQWRLALAKPSTYFFLLFYTFLSGTWTLAYVGSVPGMSISMGPGPLLVNSPYVLSQILSITSLFGIFTLAGKMGSAGGWDSFCRTQALVFSKPLSVFTYLSGRFLGGFGVVMFLFAGLPLGAWLAVLSGIPPAESVGAETLASYLRPMILMVIPNLFAAGSFFFALTALTRKMTSVYVGSAVLLLGWLFANQFTGESGSSLFALGDPTGMLALERHTQFWTLFQKNSQIAPFDGVFLANRLLWVGFGCLCLAMAFRFFTPHLNQASRRAPDESEMRPSGSSLAALQTVTPRFGGRFSIFVWLRSAWFEVRAIFNNRYFGAILICGVLFMAVSTAELGELMGTFTFPVTYLVLEEVGSGFRLFILIMVIFYSGEAVHREKTYGMHQIYDALPLPRAVPVLAKLSGLFLMILALLAILFLSGILLQLARGWTQLNLPLYAVESLIIRFSRFAMICILAVFFHVLLNHKQWAHLVTLLVLVASFAAPSLGFQHPLWVFGAAPRVAWSDMNGFGSALTAHIAYKSYWGIFCILPILLSVLLWERGASVGIMKRIRNLTKNPKVLAVGAGIGSLWVALGLALFLGGNGFQHYESQPARLAKLAAFEKRFGSFRNTPSFSVQAADLKVDLYPTKGMFQMAGTYVLENRHPQPLEQVVLHTGRFLEFTHIAPQVPHQAIAFDPEMGFFVFQLEQPVAQGGVVGLSFNYRFQKPPLPVSMGPYQLHGNGTYLSQEAFPMPGFPSDRLLQTERDRVKNQLSPLPQEKMPEDPTACFSSGLGGDTTWARVKAKVSTSGDQTPRMAAPLVSTWLEGDRRFASFDSGDQRILFFPALLSARYALAEDLWHQVALEIYHHPDHHQNVPRMMNGIKSSLEFCTTEFGPYPFGFVQILEVPRYQQSAQSFAGTIPFSESVGFIADVNEADLRGIDYPFFVTAHEMAHQWWPHQVIPANAMGANFLSESLAQYVALKILEREIGKDKMGPALALQRHAYLKGRAELDHPEPPLIYVEEEDAVYYYKGGLALYTLAEHIGEERVHEALRRYLAEFGVRDDHFPVSTDLLALFYQVTSPEDHSLIADLFEKVIFHELKVENARAKPLSDGSQEVSLTLHAQKFRSHGLGEEREVPMENTLLFAFYDETGHLLETQRRRVLSGNQTLTFTLEKPASEVEVEPYFGVIDRNLNNNRRKVERK